MKIEHYYAVFYDNEFYVGRLVNHEGASYVFKFMHRLRKSCQKQRYYDWPARPDIAEVTGKYIIHGPLDIIGNGPFSVKEIEMIDKIYGGTKLSNIKEQ